ncbi:MAG: acyl-CoA dehydrogenase [Gammaproteobacteria bacterium]|nr:acyl-CoA dehydrogenase [Gammaproteobacteria bacterium]
MNQFTLFLTVCLVFACTFAFLRSTLWLWAMFYGLLLAGFSYYATSSALLLIVFWLCFLLIFIPLLVVPLRQKLISSRLFAIYRKLLPTMSDTEREALEAGNVWWDAELFSGKPDWQKLLSMPVPTLSQEEQAFLDGPVEELCKMLDDWHITHERYDLPPEVWEFIKQQRFFAMIIPKQYGGLEFSALAHSAVVMKLSTRSVTAAVTVMVPNSLGPGILLMQYGTDAQKEYYLPRLASGEEIPCFALTGPEAGSDAGGMQDYGIVSRGEFEGKQVLGIRATWNKRYITLGPIATLLGLAFKLYDPDHLLGDKENLGITLALIPTKHPGVNIGRRHFPVNIPFQNGPNNGKDVFIPMDWVIGGQDRIGQGWRMLVECLSDGRGISLPALSTGAGKFASRTTGAYARIRKQFNVSIGEFEGVQEFLARIGGLTYLMESARILTLGSLDQGEKPSVITAIIKFHMTENMRQVVNDAMDIHGGKGVMLGPRNYLARSYQSIPVGITVEGANILTRSMIIFGQGAIRCHPYVLTEMQAAANTDPKEGLKQFDKAIFGHIGFTISNVVRTFLLGLSNAYLCLAPHTVDTAKYYRQLTRMSAAFAMLADFAMLILGGALKRRERLSARLGDVLSHLYLISAVLKHHQDQGRPEDDKVLVEWNAQRSFYLIQEAIYDFLDNFPVQSLAFALRFLIFPFGRSYSKPDDVLESRIAKLLLSPGNARDRLTTGIYLPNESDEVVYMLEDALIKTIAAESLQTRLIKAIRSGQLKSLIIVEAVNEASTTGMITDQEAKTLRAAIDASREVIAVDDFAKEEFQPAIAPGHAN